MDFFAETSQMLARARASSALTSPGARGFVIAGSEDGGSVVGLRVFARVVHFHLYTFGKRI